MKDEEMTKTDLKERIANRRQRRKEGEEQQGDDNNKEDALHPLKERVIQRRQRLKNAEGDDDDYDEAEAQHPGAVPVNPNFARGGAGDESEELQVNDEDDMEEEAGIVAATVVDMADVEKDVRKRIIGEAVLASEVQKSTAQETEEESARKRCAGIVVSSCIGLILLGTVLFLTLWEKSTDTNRTNISPTMSPTSLADLMTEEESQLFNTLDAMLPDDMGDALRRPSSPQFQAFRSLATTDDWSLVSDRELQTRYGLAVLYYTTNGDDWLNNDGWLSWGESTTTYCDWYWSSCDTCYSFVCDENGNIQQISLSGNGLQGSIPEEISLIPTQHLDLQGNSELHGTIPSTLFMNLTDLLQFNIGATGITGTLSTWIGLLTNLETLKLGELSAFGPSTIPEELYSLSRLASLEVHKSNFTGTISPSIGNLSALSAMDLSENQLTGSIPSEIGNLATLRGNLNLNNNKLTGSIPSTIDQLFGTTKIFIQHNQLTGTIPATLPNMTRLRDLRAYGNRLTGSLPVGMEKMTSMARFNIMFNELTGTVPFDVFTSWGGLKSFRLARNKFTGTLPSNATFWAKPGLNVIWLDENQLTGTIPSEIGLASELSEIGLSSNQLRGTIPRTLGSATSLDQIFLADNNFESSLPTEISFLTLLSVLDVSYNPMLTGSVPTEVSEIRSLTTVNVAGTGIAGDLSFCWAKPLMIDCETMSCSCCAEGATLCRGVDPFPEGRLLSPP